MKAVLPERVRAHLARLPAAVETAWYMDTDSCVKGVAGAEILWLDFGVREVDHVIDAGSDLKWVTALATGVDGWPLDLFQKRGLVLTNGAGLGAIPISEYVVLGLLAGLKGAAALVRAQDRREWLKRPPTLEELYGKRALIYGYGSIGHAIGERLRAFGVAVIGVRRRPGLPTSGEVNPGREAAAGGRGQGEPGVIASTEWESKLPQTDLLILAVPLTGATRALVGQPQLAALPQGAWVVNIARGGLIDEAALVAALKSGHLGGAYLDVTETEPLPPTSELWSLPNVILTPHTSWATHHLLERGAAIFLDNLQRYLRGEPLRNVVDLSSGY